MFDKLFDTKIVNNSNIIGLTSELKAIYIYNLYRNSAKNVIVVTNSLFEANNLFQTIENYTSDVLLFPMDDFLTSEALATSPELKISRLETLKTLSSGKKSIIITNLMGYLRFLPTPEIYNRNVINLKVNEDYAVRNLIEDLYRLGYSHETIVNKTGEMAVRGFVIDVFALGFSDPVRIEFWGDTIEKIKTFDIDSQLTKTNLDQITVYPNSEFLIENKIDVFEKTQKELINFGEVSNIGIYAKEAHTVYMDFMQIKTGYTFLIEEIFNYNLSIDGVKEKQYMFDFEDVVSNNALYISDFDNKVESVNETQTYNSYDIDYIGTGMDNIKLKLKKYLEEKKMIVLCIESRYKLNKFIDDFDDDLALFTDENNLDQNKINIIIKTINEGFIFNDIVVIGEKELFNRIENKKTYRTNFKMGTRIKDANKINIGDYVVHSIHGVGVYAGIKTITKDGLSKDYLQVDYRGKDKLYIPVEKIDLITKYASNDGMVPKINKLGGNEWEKIKQKVRNRIENIASELLKLYAQREAMVGFAFPKDDENQIQFEKEFAYTPTIDQLKVIDEIKLDMESPKPMDRLLCGDVGFGKTEVAFRAAFKAILGNKQVMLLCPTTILSRQHYLNAVERFKSFPVNIALLNRFVTDKEVKHILAGLKNGSIDLVIGTHRLLSGDLTFKDLGLMIVDEEQRFGVKHKEKIKQIKTNIDVLTLSATPIPRTIQMAMTGIRSLSLIETAPVNRYPVQTYVLAENNQIIKDAIYKELSRHGQIFILYNSIEDMHSKLSELQRLVPEARIISAHGQMPKSVIENVMLKFTNREYDILLCTTIIETGIDIPSVNTLIIIDADRFGLAQLYQIRGRVGRSNKIAYCYLMYNKGKILSEIATKRLKVIKDFTELGSGFAIAMRDLSIRGAGDILGSEQAGFIDTIGIELFTKMLNNEINRIKGIVVDEEEQADIQPLINVATAISNDYVQDEELKITIHKRINEIDSYDKLIEVKNELEDRFGKIDDNMLVYMYQELFEKISRDVSIFKINQTKNFIEVILNKDLTLKINGEKLFFGLNEVSRMFRFSMKFGRLTITLDTIKLDRHFIYYLIEMINIIKSSS